MVRPTPQAAEKKPSNVIICRAGGFVEPFSPGALFDCGARWMRIVEGYVDRAAHIVSAGYLCWHWLVAGCDSVMGMHAQHWPGAILRRMRGKVPLTWRQARDKPMTWQRGQCLRGRMRIVQTRQWPACWVVAVAPQGGQHGL